MRVFALAGLMFFASIAGAADPVSALWQKKTRQSIELLKRGDYKASLKISQGVVRDMVYRLGPGTTETQSFAIALTHKALALAGLGRHDEALWEWHVALNLYPGLAKADLSAFGEAGKFLLANAELQKPAGMPKGSAQPLTANMRAPQIRKRVEPQYPEGAQYFAVSGITIVEVIITREGRVVRPLVLKSLPAPTITYAALDALRRWRFEPGIIDGQPVDVIFNVTFNFKLP